MEENASILFKKYVSRVIPRPKEIEIYDAIRIKAGEIGLFFPERYKNTPPLDTALEKLKKFSLGNEKSLFRIELYKNDGHNCSIPVDLSSKILDVSNNEQAYAIYSTHKRVILLANNDIGLLYAATTLLNMVKPPRSISKNTFIEIPIMKIIDWPDLEERGLWGGDSEEDIEWTSRFKLNYIDSRIVFKVSKDDFFVEVNRPVLCLALKNGVRFIVHIPHLSSLARFSLTERYPGIVGVISPDKKIPINRLPLICYSKEDTINMLSEIMIKIASIENVEELNIWLSEEGPFCSCDRCKGKPENVYKAEIKAILEGYRRVKKLKPEFKLRILLSQGTYPLNEKIIKMIPKDVKIIYYHGRFTYTSEKIPIIYDLLEKYVKEGGWLGVYPQLTNSWRTVFPLSSPDFIRYRMEEFIEKGLRNVTGYATPSNIFWQINLIAFAEYSWNLKGRSIEEFGEALANYYHINDTWKFIEWLKIISKLSWSLAASKFPYYLVWHREEILGNKLKYGEGILKEVTSEEKIQENILMAKKAVEMAQDLGDVFLSESKIILFSYIFLKDIIEYTDVVNNEYLSDNTVDNLLKKMTYDANSLAFYLWRWVVSLDPESLYVPYRRFSDTVALFHLTVRDAYKIAESKGLSVKRSEYVYNIIGKWYIEIPPIRKFETIKIDATYLMDKGDTYYILLESIDGNYELSLNSLCIKDDEKIIVEIKDFYRDMEKPKIMKGKWYEIKLDVPEMRDKYKRVVLFDFYLGEYSQKYGRVYNKGVIYLRKPGEEFIS